MSEYSEACLAYEEAISAERIALSALKTAEYHEQRYRTIWHNISRLAMSTYGSSEAFGPEIRRDISEAHDAYIQSEEAAESAFRAHFEAVERANVAYEAFIEDEAHLGCAALFGFNSEQCLHPNYQAQLIALSLLKRRDHVARWPYLDPAMKRAVVKQLLSMVGVTLKY
jgi:hypothetical protein